jgi:hypothetical protein
MILPENLDRCNKIAPGRAQKCEKNLLSGEKNPAGAGKVS